MLSEPLTRSTQPCTEKGPLCERIPAIPTLLQHVALHLFATIKVRQKYIYICICKYILYLKQKIQIQLTVSLSWSLLHCIWSSAGHLELASGQVGNTCVLVCACPRPDTNMSCLTHQPEPPRLSGTNAAYVPLSTRCSTPTPIPTHPPPTTTTHSPTLHPKPPSHHPPLLS